MVIDIDEVVNNLMYQDDDSDFVKLMSWIYGELSQGGVSEVIDTIGNFVPADYDHEDSR